MTSLRSHDSILSLAWGSMDILWPSSFTVAFTKDLLFQGLNRIMIGLK
jgi:hypothetical protein